MYIDVFIHCTTISSIFLSFTILIQTTLNVTQFYLRFHYVGSEITDRLIRTESPFTLELVFSYRGLILIWSK